ncbi:NAD(P)H-binding protein [Flavobacterium sp. KACC 22761]|uniref:NAD(P)H-binding protein n=1 Tax=Flavobacterium sp. KACC 22761 TaxID=3092665 RepID=UPI002A75D870|nr:NAD(P)H-binding protein [Flavobacterium sp. KACC 22761]WPO78888.1 NAD(P)H-binding protein [Flavobacterium sp. KACC 22761]
MKAIIIGATGSTGKELVEALLKNNDYSSISIFVRRSIGKTHPKLSEHIVDFSKIDQFKDLITGDVLFSCLGTTLKVAGSKENQWKIDFDIPAAFARIGKENNIKSFVLVSSYGASAKSSVFYSKMKGKLEDFIAELHFEQYLVFRPGPLIRENTDRLGEKISVKVIKFFNGIGLFKNLKPISTAFLAEKLAIGPKKLPEGTTILELDAILNLN